MRKRNHVWYKVVNINIEGREKEGKVEKEGAEEKEDKGVGKTEW